MPCSKKRRILLINNGYPSSTQPKFTTWIKNIKECIEQCDYTVDLIVLDTNYKGAVDKYIHYLKFYLRLLLFRHYSEYDIVYINQFPYCFIAVIPYLHKIKKLVIHWHGNDIIHLTKGKGLLNWVSYQFIRKRFFHITPSHFFAEKTAEKINVRVEDIFVSPSGGVDTLTFKEYENKEKHSGVIRLGFASGLLAEKGTDLVVELMKNKQGLENRTGKKIELHYIDYGKNREQYNKLLSELPDVYRLEAFPKENMPQFYSLIDILLFPTLYEESFGLVSVEAMSCEVPVVGSNAAALKETIINGVSGELFIRNDSADFKRAIVTCIENIATYIPRKKVLELYGREAVVDNYKHFFEKVLSV